MRELFGTDGVRGIANKGLTVSLAMDIARAAAAELHKAGEKRPTVLIGRDTRISGDMLAAAMTAGFCAAGADVIDLGICPTAEVAYLTRTMDVVIGTVISASHNPFEYNGIKFFSHQGFKLPDSVELSIEQHVRHADKLKKPLGSEVGRQLSSEDANEQYYNYLRTLAPDGFSGMRVVIDCANGAVSALAPRLFREMGAEITSINCQPDGLNINANCGATFPEMVAAVTTESGAEVGLSFDGDADRLLMSDEKGRLVDGDHIMAFAGKYLFDAGLLPHGMVVGTVMSNLGLERGLEKMGMKLLRTKVGDRYVLEEMQKCGAVLGGEQSGHLIFLDHATTGDGLVTALLAMKIMRETGMPLSALSDIVEDYPQRLINVVVSSVKGWDKHKSITKAIAAAEADLGNDGRVLVRASGTEPKIRVMVEALEQPKVDNWCTKIAETIRTAMS